ncbi:CAP domain-containing protein [Pueribacillus sp. YX66]|uniref:CAP domain-containing protein n=1 Tax=Pueribacillus sp. YX66 TaxID=3229242 RepID=UPI00358CE206
MVKRAILILFLIFFLGGCQYVNQHKKPIPNKPIEFSENVDSKQIDIVQLIGKDVNEVVEHFGNPTDKYPSNYHYEWLIYNHQPETYIQVGHIDNKIVTMFILGQSIMNEPISIGMSYDEIMEQLPLKNSVVMHVGDSDYRFDLTATDIQERPLVQLSEEAFAQLYFDRFLNQLVAIRLLDKKTLLAQRPYRIVYRGSLEEINKPNEKQQKEIENANVKQIFEITNVLRKRYGKSSLQWNDNVATAAFKHSKDMKDNQYFDHHSPTKGDLENRLKTENVTYFLAGENIAAEYPDGIAAVMGWLNSEGHRETMLHEKFTDLGVGVYEKHYTQNFITK